MYRTNFTTPFGRAWATARLSPMVSPLDAVPSPKIVVAPDSFKSTATAAEAAEAAPVKATDVNVAAIVGSVVAALAVLGIAGAGFAAMNGLLPF